MYVVDLLGAFSCRGFDWHILVITPGIEKSTNHDDAVPLVSGRYVMNSNRIVVVHASYGGVSSPSSSSRFNFPPKPQGTYIKEFVHGDLGRTVPSVGSLLKCRADILQLDVTNVEDRWSAEEEEGERGRDTGISSPATTGRKE